MDTNKKSCDICRYSAFDDRGDLVCRKYAPKPIVISVNENDDDDNENYENKGIVYHYARFPIVYPDWWCGEFEIDTEYVKE